jgi:CBS domain-containing protein
MKRNEQISNIMSKDLVTAHVGQKLSELRILFSEGNFHHLPVVSGENLVGLITSSDILRASFGNNEQEVDSTLDHTAQLENIMQKKPLTISMNSTVRDAAEKLATGSFHCLPVVDGEKLVGLVTSTDLISYLLEQY